MAAAPREHVRRVPMYQVDAFARTPFTGNPAAVCLLSPEHLPLSDALRQRIAAENNLAETAFVECAAGGGAFAAAARFRLRWFTPMREVPLCGHATLASAAVLFGELGNPSPEIVFETASGPLRVVNSTPRPESGLVLRMSLPTHEPIDEPPQACPDEGAPLVRALCGDLQVREVRFCKALKYLLLVLDPSTTRQQLRELRPDLTAAQAASKDDEIFGVIVAAATGGEPGAPDVCSRFFAPWAGIPEDPVTGSAAAVLGPPFAASLGRRALSVEQCSPRTGHLQLDVQAGRGVVDVSGSAVTVLVATLFVPPEA